MTPAPPALDNCPVESAAAPRPGSGSGGLSPGDDPGQQLLGRGGGSAPSAVPALDGIPAPRAALVSRFAELFGSEAPFSHRRWGERLDRALARMDRYAAFGAGRDRAGLDFALALLEGEAEEVRWGRRTAPASLAYYVPLLEEVGKQWRRNGARRSASAPAGRNWRGTWANPKERKKPARGG